jgi:predicted Zn-dependent protease with MMP-like domain
MTIQQIPPSMAEIETLAHEAMASIPAELSKHLGPVVLRVEEFPDAETEAEMELESPFDLLGLYRGTALPHKSVMSTAAAIDMIFLYRRPILDYWCETGEELSHIVRHLMIHEIGHHFGFSDDDMDRLENEA